MHCCQCHRYSPLSGQSWGPCAWHVCASLCTCVHNSRCTHTSLANPCTRATHTGTSAILYLPSVCTQADMASLWCLTSRPVTGMPWVRVPGVGLMLPSVVHQVGRARSPSRGDAAQRANRPRALTTPPAPPGSMSPSGMMVCWQLHHCLGVCPGPASLVRLPTGWT